MRSSDPTPLLHHSRATKAILVLSSLAMCAAAIAFGGCSKEPAGNGTAGSPPNTAGKAGTSSSGKKKIVFVFKVGGITYSEACKAGAQQANDDPALNAEVTYEAPTEATAAAQNGIIEQAIVNHVDAIVVSPNDADAIIPSIDKATSAGIKVFTWDSDAPKSKRLFYVCAADDIQIGVTVADALAKSMGEKGKALIFSGGRTAANLTLHLQGIQQGLKKYPGISVIQPVIYNDDDQNKATTFAVNALQANPDATGIACCNTPSPPAAGEAIRKLNLIGKVSVWGLGLPSSTRPYILDGSVSGLYLWNPQRLTYLTAKLVREALDNKNPVNGDKITEGAVVVDGPRVILPLTLEINKKNVESLKF